MHVHISVCVYINAFMFTVYSAAVVSLPREAKQWYSDEGRVVQ